MSWSLGGFVLPNPFIPGWQVDSQIWVRSAETASRWPRGYRNCAHMAAEPKRSTALSDSQRRDSSVARFAQCLLALRNCPPFVSADPIHCAQRGLEVVAACIFHIAQSQKDIVTGCPDPTQVEITFGNGARFLNVQEIIAAFGRNSHHALDAGFTSESFSTGVARPCRLPEFVGRSSERRSFY